MSRCHCDNCRTKSSCHKYYPRDNCYPQKQCEPCVVVVNPCPTPTPTPPSPPPVIETAGLRGYAYVYDVRPAPALPQVVAPGAPILFSSNGPALGITHSPGSGNIVFGAAGVYSVTVNVATTEPVAALQLSAYLNGLPLGTFSGTSFFNTAGTGGSWSFIIPASAGDILTIVNKGATPITLSQAVTTTAPFEVGVGASVTIHRIA